MIGGVVVRVEAVVVLPQHDSQEYRDVYKVTRNVGRVLNSGIMSDHFRQTKPASYTFRITGTQLCTAYLK